MVFLGIDLGTSALKAVLVDQAQTVLAQAARPVTTATPRAGWSEQDPDDWWRALRSALAELRAKRPEAYAEVRTLGLSGQMHAALLVDASGRPVRPAILWNDGRAARECTVLQDTVPDLERITGVAATPGFTAPKLLWLKQNEPESFRRAAKLLLAKDYLRLRLTGEAATDMADAAGTLLFDQARRDWADALLDACGLSRRAVPSLMEGNEAGGKLLAEVVAELGLHGNTIVAGGAGDAAAAAIGVGAVAEGDAFISLGTSAQLFVSDESYRPQPGTLIHCFAHALPDRWFGMAAMLNGASCLDFVARLLGVSDIDGLLRQTEARHQGPSRLLFLPYLSGERTPHNDPHARGVFAGLDHDASATDLVQAVLEGVAFSLLEARRLMVSAGLAPAEMAVVGGGARSRFWMQMLANVLGVRLVRYRESGVGPAFGAARLARIALTGETPEAVCVKPPVLDELLPDKALTRAYAERFEHFRSLYRSLKPAFQRRF